MRDERKSLIDMQKEAKSHGVSARRFCELAGIPWQSFYRKRHKEGLVRLSEYDKLTAALEAIVNKGGKHGNTRKTEPKGS